GILFELFPPDGVMPVNVPTLRALKEAVQRHQVPHDEFTHVRLPIPGRFRRGKSSGLHISAHFSFSQQTRVLRRRFADHRRLLVSKPGAHILAPSASRQGSTRTLGPTVLECDWSCRLTPT